MKDFYILAYTLLNGCRLRVFLYGVDAMLNKMMRASLSAVLLLASANVMAASITCPGLDQNPDRQMTLGSADDCEYGAGNPDAATVSGYFGGVWTKEGELTSNGTDDLLTISGASFGDIPTSGLWQIAASFWNTYAQAVITVHIGQGGGDPDHWAFLITPNEISGSWSLTKLSGNGGGLSNFKLWGSGEPTTDVPEPGTLALLGLGILGLGLVRRRAV
jgi:hypothetical protein